VAVEFPPLALGGLSELEDHGQAGDPRAGTLGPGGTQAHRSEGGFDGVGGAQVQPVLSGEVVEGEQRVTVLGEAFSRLRVAGAKGCQEAVEGFLCLGPGLVVLDLGQGRLVLGLDRFGQLIEDVGGLVHPAALSGDIRPDLLEGLPEAQGAVADRDLGRVLEATCHEAQQHLLPGLGAFAHAVLHCDQLFGALRRGPHDHQDALVTFFEADIEVDPIDPDVDVALARLAAPVPGRVVFLPDLLEAHDRGR
jgi:hypothetical protein